MVNQIKERLTEDQLNKLRTHNTSIEELLELIDLSNASFDDILEVVVNEIMYLE